MSEFTVNEDDLNFFYIMLVQTDTRISLKGSFIMSTIMVELIELEMKKIDSSHLVQFLAESTYV